MQIKEWNYHLMILCDSVKDLANNYVHLLTDGMKQRLKTLCFLNFRPISQSFGNSEYTIQDGWWIELFFPLVYRFLEPNILMCNVAWCAPLKWIARAFCKYFLLPLYFHINGALYWATLNWNCSKFLHKRLIMFKENDVAEIAICPNIYSPLHLIVIKFLIFS